MDRDITEFERGLLDMIISTCERDPAMAEGIDATSPLLGPHSMLGLDSLDAVEIVALIQAKYGVRITSKETSSEILSSLRSISDYINSQQK